MFDALSNITLLIPTPDFRQMAYASIDDMVAEAWISPEAVTLTLPVALANLRGKKAAGFQLDARERVTPTNKPDAFSSKGHNFLTSNLLQTGPGGR